MLTDGVAVCEFCGDAEATQDAGTGAACSDCGPVVRGDRDDLRESCDGCGASVSPGDVCDVCGVHCGPPCRSCGRSGLHHEHCETLAPADWCPLCQGIGACSTECPTRHLSCVCGPDHDCRATGCDPDCGACCG